MPSATIPRPHSPRLSGPQRQFGAYVKSARIAKRLGVRAFAERIGLAAGHWSNVENGRATAPADEMLQRAAEVLELPIGALRCRAGRLGEADLQRFWSSPMIPGLIQASTGWTSEEAQLFQAILLQTFDAQDDRHDLSSAVQP
jgi:transcriptional regulator with XRE-family HTH domain